ncbi:hypothetical protein H5T58_00015 [Candidatus Parcubacteria bacterium]|nr:hypothetical protein [Candidatus Parcubacteria bacterium]
MRKKSNFKVLVFSFFFLFLIVLFPKLALALEVCFPGVQMKCEEDQSTGDTKILRRYCLSCCFPTMECEGCGPPETVSICNPWQSCVPPIFSDWTWTVLPFIDMAVPFCEFDPMKMGDWMRRHEDEIKIDEKDITLWDGVGKVGEDENGNSVPVNLPVKFRWITDVPGIAGLGLSCGPDGFGVTAVGGGLGGLGLIFPQFLPLEEAFSEEIPLREYFDPLYRNTTYDQVPFEYRSMVEEPAFKDEEIRDICPETTNLRRWQREAIDRIQLKQKWQEAFNSDASHITEIKKLANFLDKFTHDYSLTFSSRIRIVQQFFGDYGKKVKVSSRPSSLGGDLWQGTISVERREESVPYEKIKRALWGNLNGRYSDAFHIEVLQRRKQIEYFIRFKECKETTNQGSALAQKLKELSEKICGTRRGRSPSVSHQEMLNELRRASEKVAFLYSPSQDRGVGPCKLPSKPLASEFPLFLPSGYIFSLFYARDLGRQFGFSLPIPAFEPLGTKTFLVNPTPEPIGFLVFRIYDPGYLQVDISGANFNNLAQKISWTFSTTTQEARFSAEVERWVDPDWNGPDFLDVAKGHMQVSEPRAQLVSRIPIVGADFVDFMFCGQDGLGSNLGAQLRAKYRGEILLFAHSKDLLGQNRDVDYGFILDPEGEPLPPQELIPTFSGDPQHWREVFNTAYSEHGSRKCVNVKEPPPTLLNETAYYTWPFTGRSRETDPGAFFGVLAHQRPRTADLKTYSNYFSWLGRAPPDRKARGIALLQSDAENHALLDTAFLRAPEPPYVPSPVPPEYEIDLCHPAQYPSRLRWTLLTEESIDDLRSFLQRALLFNLTQGGGSPATLDLLKVLENSKVRENCIDRGLIDNLGWREEPVEWSRHLQQRVGERTIEECVKALTKAIQEQIDAKCPASIHWLHPQTDSFRIPAQEMEIELDWVNDAYDPAGFPPIYPNLLWWQDVKYSLFPAWPRVNAIEFRFANLDILSRPASSWAQTLSQLISGTPAQGVESLVSGPWSQKWHFRMATGFYKMEEVPLPNSNQTAIRYSIFTPQDLEAELRLDPLLGNANNLREAKHTHQQFVVNRLHTLIFPQIGRILSFKALAKESASFLGGLGEWFRIALPIPRFSSQIRYRPTEAISGPESRCQLQDLNFWQMWPSLVVWRHPDLLDNRDTDVHHLLRRSIYEWYDNNNDDDPAGINNVSPEQIRRHTLTNELYFYFLPCQDEWGKSGNCYGWVGFERSDNNTFTLTYHSWMEDRFTFSIVGHPPQQIQPGTDRYPGTSPSPQDLPPVRIPNTFSWNSVVGGARYLLEIARGLIESDPENDENVSVEARDLERIGQGKRMFSEPGKSQIFVDFFRDEGPYTFTVRTCADYCDELGENDTPSSSEKLWCGLPSRPRYFYGCFLKPPENPQSPTLGASFLPRENIEFSWDPITCANYPIYYQLRVVYSLRDHRESDPACEPQTEVLNVFLTEPHFATNTFHCLGTYHWAIRACAEQRDNLNDPSVACTNWTDFGVGEWSKLWYFNITTNRPQRGGAPTPPRFCRQCENIIPQNCRNVQQIRNCGLRELVQMIFNILNCLLWCISFLLLIILIGATGALLILKAGEFEILERIKNAWKGYAIGLLIMFFAWNLLNIIFQLMGWRRAVFGDWWNPFP